MADRARRRHPVCPQCGYDLVGTIAAGRGVCPECGLVFDRDDLDPRRRGWLPPPGFRRAAVVTAIRSVACLPVVTGLFLLVKPGLAAPPYWRPLVVVAIAGLALGAVQAVGLPEQAGFEAPRLAGLAAAGAWGTVGAATVLSFLVGPPAAGPAAPAVLLATAGFATLWIIRALLLGE